MLTSFVLISAVGLVPNTLSISYFIRIENQGLTNKLMICLNLSDILSLITSASHSINILMEKIIEVNETLVGIAFILLNSFPVISGCITFMITLLRTIVIHNPFYHARKRVFVVSLMFVIVVSLPLVLGFWNSAGPFFESIFRLFGFVILGLSCINIAMSTAAIIVLKKSGIEGHQDKNYAAVTMVIISVICFTTSLLILAVQVITGTHYSTEITDEVANKELNAFLVYMMELSISCLFNPLVYIIIKHQLRTYIKSCLERLGCSLVSTSTINPCFPEITQTM